MFNATARIVDKTPALKKRVATGSFKSLGHAGGFIRTTASRSIRKNKRPSRPGSAPHTQTGNLRRAFRFEIAKGKGELVVGPINTIGGKLWDLLEFGGKGRPRRLLKAQKHRVGDFGPIAVARKPQRKRGADPNNEALKRDYVRIKLLSVAQARRADGLIASENAARRKQNDAGTKYAARPFMGPALDKAKSRLPKFWRNSVHQ